MARGSVDTLLVTDEEKRYLGTVSIGDIRHWGRELNLSLIHIWTFSLMDGPGMLPKQARYQLRYTRL